jgi:D-ribulokinase
MIPSGYALGVDFGTSGARAIALHPTGRILAQSRHAFAPGEVSSPTAWQGILFRLIGAIAPDIRANIRRIAINGTSATVLLCNKALEPLTPALLYNDPQARSALNKIQPLAPPDSPTLSATSSLVKALWFYEEGLYEQRRAEGKTDPQDLCLAHQADWIAALLHGQPPVSDYHNALKLGYDVHTLAYPDWLQALPIAPWLPTVRVPGDVIAPVLSAIAQQFSLPADCQICAGTTDSIAAFLASGASQPGEAVTSLGSTLVLKLLSRQPIDHQAFGIYSHRLGDLWLVGGASNTGGAVLQQFFSPAQIAALSAQIDPSQPSAYHYYPLTAPGERFPINDPDYPPQLSPRPEQDKDFLHGLLDAIARIEGEGYAKLQALGAPALTRVYTAGGGAKNATWQALRQRRLGVNVLQATQTEAAYGSAQLAMHGLKS